MSGTWDRTVRTAPSPARLAEEARIRTLYENLVIPNVGGPTRITNEPVGAALGWPQRRGPGTAPSNARMAELERIARLYGYLPAIDQQFIAALGGAPTPTARGFAGEQMPESMPPLQPGTIAALSAPVPQPIVGNAIPSPVGANDPLIQVPAGPSPRTEPTQPAVPPQERAAAAPQNPGEQNFWDRLLGPRQSVGRDIETNTTRRASREARDLLLEQEEMDRAALASGRTSSPAEPAAPTETTPPAEAGPPQGPSVSGGGGAGAPNYAALNVRDPDFAAIRAQYEQGRPRQRERDPEERMLRIIASALGGMQGRNGLEVASGAVAGLGAGYARESDRDEGLWQRDEDARRTFELGLAGLLGQQEQAQFNNAMTRAQFQQRGDIARDELALRRETAGQSALYNRLRIASLARQMGMDSDPAQVLARGISSLVTTPGAQIMVDGRPLMFEHQGRQLTFGQLYRALETARGDPAQTRQNPLFATNPGMAERGIQRDMSDLVMSRIMQLEPAQRNQVLQQLARLQESRARAGSTRIAEE